MVHGIRQPRIPRPGPARRTVALDPPVTGRQYARSFQSRHRLRYSNRTGSSPLRRVAALLLLAAALSGAARPASAATARDLSGRIRIDGFTSDFTDSESVFGNNPDGTPQEASDDSKWGVNDDINQIRITWDARYLYLAGEGKIWSNNMILFIDSVQGQGLARMDSLNSWRRNFFFDSDPVNGFQPDLFLATWDGNTAPRLITQIRGQTVEDDVPGALFSAAATFSQGNSGRAMEAAIPWSTVFLAQAGLGVRETLVTVGGVSDTTAILPRGAKIRICGVITGGGDGSGGPDAAPDNVEGLSSDAGAAAVIDNYATIDLDRNDDTGLGHGGPDGVADWGVEPKSRVSFRFPPPILGLRFCIADLTFDRPVLLPDLGEHIHFSLKMEPTPDPADPNNQVRTVLTSAFVYDMHGRPVRTLYTGLARPVLDVNDPVLHDRYDSWDGRDDRGAIVPPGIYVVRLVTGQGECRALRSFAVVR